MQKLYKTKDAALKNPVAGKKLVQDWFWGGKDNLDKVYTGWTWV